MSIGLAFKGVRKRFFLLPRRPRPGVEEAVTALQSAFGYRTHRPEADCFDLEFAPGAFLHLVSVPNGVEGEAVTSATGPGFHKAVVDFLDALAREMQLRLEVDDDAGYWQGRDFERLKDEHQAWLTRVVEIVTQPGFEPCVVAWRPGWKPAELGGVCTPVGRFQPEPLRGELDHDGLEAFSRRFYVWYGETRDALYHRGAALRLLWSEVRWGPPRGDEEQELLERTADSLATARRLDPDLPLPVAAWREVLTLLGGDPDAATGPAMAEDGQIGYRREDLRITFAGGWEARLPGELSAMREDGRLAFRDEDRIFTMAQIKPGAPSSYTQKGTPVAFDVGGCRYLGSWWEDEEKPGAYWFLTGEVTHNGAEAVAVVIAIRSLSWLDWAIATFRSVRPPRSR